MLEPDDAARRIVAAITPLGAVELPLLEAAGLVLASDVVSPVSLPLWANSAMDGYACHGADVRSASSAAPVQLRVVDHVRAGAFPERAIKAGEATRIATGAPVPHGADTVVRIEDTDGGESTVLVRDARDAGRNVRPAGEDVLRGNGRRGGRRAWARTNRDARRGWRGAWQKPRALRRSRETRGVPPMSQEANFAAAASDAPQRRDDSDAQLSYVIWPS